PSQMARALEIDEIERIVQAFESSASLLKESGIDAIEINSHCGYIFDEFLTPLWNKRQDQYGGSLENRLRFIMESIEAIKRGAGDDYPILFKYGLTHYLDGGRTVEEGQEIARRLEAAGIAGFDIDAGCYERPWWYIPPTTQPAGCIVDLAEKTKEVVSVPVISVGKLGEPKLAEKVLRQGRADFIGLGRSLLADPEWSNKVKEGWAEDVRPCLGCMEGCVDRMRVDDYVSCTVNPATGMETEYTIEPAQKPKSLLIIGGGPSGIEAAMIAAQRGHKVTIWEKGRVLGGNLRLAAAPEFKQDYRRLIDYFETQVKKLGIKVKLGKEATVKAVEEFGPDAVIIASGGLATYPNIHGKDGDNVTSSLDLSKMMRGLLTGSDIRKKKGFKKVIYFLGNIFGRFMKPAAINFMSKFWLPFGKRVIIIGAGYDGCEMALMLAQRGRKVTVLESGPQAEVLKQMFATAAFHLLKLLADNGVTVLTDTKAMKITDEGVIVSAKDGKKSTLEADTVMITVEVKPDDKLLKALKGKVGEVHAVGDCVEPGRAIKVLWPAFHLARQI
ncbi:FAD-dependent oxidoreductase, partial [Chloroflexota bacterium]